MAGGKYNFLLFRRPKNQVITLRTGRANSAVNYKKILAFTKRYRVRKSARRIFGEYRNAFLFG
jgi:hypothetical protein